MLDNIPFEIQMEIIEKVSDVKSLIQFSSDPTVVKIIQRYNKPWHVEVFTLSLGVWNVIPSSNLLNQSIELTLLSQVAIGWITFRFSVASQDTADIFREDLHPKLPGPEERIVDFSEGKVGVYIKFFEFANFRLPLSQFLFDYLGHYQIHLSQLSVIDAAKVSHFEINYRVLNIVPTLNLFRVFYIPSFNSRWMSFSKRPGKNTPQCYTKPLDSLKNWNNQIFWVDERVFPTVADWRTSAPKDEMPARDTYFAEAVTILNTHRTPIQKQPEALLCLVDMDLFNLIRAPNPTKVKTDTRPRAAHEVPFLTVTASRVIEMKNPATATDSSEVPSTIERSPLDFANENPSQQSTRGNEIKDQGQETVAPKVPPSENVTTTRVALEAGLEEEITAIGSRVIKERRKRGNDVVDTNAPPKDTHVDVRDPDPLSFANSQSIPTENVAQHASISYSSVLDSDLPKEWPFLEIQNRRIPPLPPWSRIQARENEIKNLEALLEAETDMKKTTKAKNAELAEAGVADVVSAGIAKGMSEGLKYGVEHGKANLGLEDIKAYDPEADTKYVAALHALRDLKYPMADQLETLKDAPIDIPVYPEVRDPKDHWAFKEEILLADAIVANVSHAEKKKKCRVVCHTHGVSSTHHVISDSVPVSVPIVAPQGLPIMLADAATQTETSEDGASPRICTGSVSCAPWESSRMHLAS
nr:hypothetical protein [Tanacetum cinerariifolium]